MLQIFLIRHGETGLEGRYKGHLDVPLSQAGRKRLVRTADHLKNLLKGKPDAIYSSDLVRAVQSSRIIARTFGMEDIIEVPALRERYFGLWEGLHYKEIQKKFPEDFALWMKDPLKNSPTNGESTNEVKKRVLPALKEILKNHFDGEKIIVVSHGGATRVLLCHFLGLPLRWIFRIGQDFGCVNIIELYGKTPIVRLMNGGPLE
jgi:alpha-ribazole phosphatase